MVTIFLISAILLLTLSQILQKVVADRASRAKNFYRTLIGQPVMWAAVACLGIGTFNWLLALSHFEVSTIYPLLSITFILTTVFSICFLKERLTGSHKLGIALVVVGVGLMGVA